MVCPVTPSTMNVVSVHLDGRSSVIHCDVQIKVVRVKSHDTELVQPVFKHAHNVVRSARSEDEHIPSFTTVHRVTSAATIEHIVALAAFHGVVADPSKETIRAAPSKQPVVSSLTQQAVISGIAKQRVVPGPCRNDVLAPPGINSFAVRGSCDHVIPTEDRQRRKTCRQFRANQ